MSSMAGVMLIGLAASVGPMLMGVAASVGPMPDGRVAGTTVEARMCANDHDPNAIVVCADRAGPPPRLPMRDDRAEPGEVTHYLADGLGQMPDPPGEPSKLGQTIGTVVRGVRSLLTGEDPGY